MSRVETAAAITVPPSLGALFVGFLSMSLFGFGGVLPWARRILVEQKRWMDADEFNEALSLCKVLPGPNIVNFAIIYGSRVHGPLGAIAALVALIAPSAVIVLAMGMAYQRFGYLPQVQNVVAALSAAAAGLVVAMAAKMATPLIGRPGPGPAVAVAVFVAVGVLRLPLPWVLAVALPASIALSWYVHR